MYSRDSTESPGSSMSASSSICSVTVRLVADTAAELAAATAAAVVVVDAGPLVDAWPLAAMRARRLARAAAAADADGRRAGGVAATPPLAVAASPQPLTISERGRRTTEDGRWTTDDRRRTTEDGRRDRIAVSAGHVGARQIIREKIQIQMIAMI